MQLTLPVYVDRAGALVTMTTVGLGPYTRTQMGLHPTKVEQALISGLREALKTAPPSALEWFELKLGTKLERVRVELTLRGKSGRRKVSGQFPLVVEPRWAADARPLVIAYHPQRQDEWFPVDEALPLAEQAAAMFQKHWAELDEKVILRLETRAKDSIRPLAFDAEPRTLLDDLPASRRGIWDDLKIEPPRKPDGTQEPGQEKKKILATVGANLTLKAVDRSLATGLPRSPLREQLALLLGGVSKKPTVLIGPPGSGKTTLAHRLIADLLEQDGYFGHRNLDRVHQLWLVAGKRIIAGMSYLGDWEQRCVDLLSELRGKRVILYVEDLPHFGRLGQHRDSSRSFASFFRGPLERGEVMMLGECTPEAWQRLEDDAPGFAGLFTKVVVPPTAGDETLRMLLARARELELSHEVRFHPAVYRSILDLGQALFPGTAQPGQALDLLVALAAERRGQRDAVVPEAVLSFLSRRTGLPQMMLRPEMALDPSYTERNFGARIVEQPEAVRAARDLVVRIKTGLVDPARPFGVLLFTGPTGTGKTEMAKAIAATLYGDARRMHRFDMGELSGPDAPSRLIGDRWRPEGLLTRALIEQPFSVVLLDEIEKAHPSVLNLLLQVFDDGRLTEASGQVARFTQSVVIMTSNLGAKVRPPAGFGEESAEAIMADVARAVREFFPPELFNRIDKIVRFLPLPPAAATAIATRELGNILKRRGLAERNVIVALQPGVVERVVSEAFDARDGARSVKRYLEDKVATKITAALAAQARAPLMFARLRADADFSFELTPLSEAAPLPGRATLAPLLELSTRELRARLPALAAEVAGIAEGADLAALSQALRENLRARNALNPDERVAVDDSIYRMETLRTRISEFGDMLRKLAEAPLDEGEETEILRFGVDEERGVRLFDRAAMTPRTPHVSRDAILEHFAEVGLLRRLLGTPDDPRRHGAVLVLERIGVPGWSTLMHWLSEAYGAGRAWVSPRSYLMRDGRVLDKTHEWVQLRAIAFEVHGLGAAEALAAEDGCHVWQSTHLPPQLLRVQVLPSGTVVAEALGELHRVRAHEEAGSVPVGLPPVVRALRCEPRDDDDDDEDNRPTACDVEDFRLGWSDTMMVTNVTAALRRALLLHASRVVDPVGDAS